MSILHSDGIKARLRGALVEAMRSKRNEEVKVLRSLLTAIDNAEAPPVGTIPPTSSEIERLTLSAAELAAVLHEEVASRRRAAAELAALSLDARAQALVEQAAIAERHIAGLAAD